MLFMNKTIASGRLKNEIFFRFKVLHSKAFCRLMQTLLNQGQRTHAGRPHSFPFVSGIRHRCNIFTPRTKGLKP
ncbi:hypothetical protein FAH66_06285 [Neisseria subflava]|nr:hypothetical protein FAH66_06285 [Neisseria subflava]